MFLLIPPGFIGDKNRLAIGHAAFKLEGPGAVGVHRRIAIDLGGEIGRLLAIVILQPLGVEDEDIGDVVEEKRGGCGDVEIDGIIIDLLHACKNRNIAAQRRSGIRGAREGRDDIVSGEIGAIMEFHTLAQGETPCLSINKLPFRRKSRLDLEIGSVTDKPLIDMIEKGEIGGGRHRIWIERIKVGAAGPTQGFSTCGNGNGGRRQGGQDETSHSGHLIPPFYKSLKCRLTYRPDKAEYCFAQPYCQ